MIFCAKRAPASNEVSNTVAGPAEFIALMGALFTVMVGFRDLGI